MGLFDFPLSQPVSGVLAPPQATATPAQQNWINALGALSAAMKDAGAFMQHQPQAANNVANFLRQRNGAPVSPPALPALPPNILAAALLNAAQPRIMMQAPNLTATPSAASATRPDNMAPAVRSPSGNLPPPQNLDEGWLFERVK